MINNSRLDSIFPKLANAFRQASVQKRRQAAFEACALAVSLVGLDEAKVKAAIDVLRSGGIPSPSMKEELETLAAHFDDQYIDLDEDGNDASKREALYLFSKARAVTALVFAVTQDPEQLHEAVYEAISAINNPDEVVRVVEKVLSS